MHVCNLHVKGNFVSVRLEMAAAARAQAAGGQEFADFSTELGVGTYIGQVLTRRRKKIYKYTIKYIIS